MKLFRTAYKEKNKIKTGFKRSITQSLFRFIVQGRAR